MYSFNSIWKYAYNHIFFWFAGTGQIPSNIFQKIAFNLFWFTKGRHIPSNIFQKYDFNLVWFAVERYIPFNIIQNYNFNLVWFAGKNTWVKSKQNNPLTWTEGNLEAHIYCNPE